MADFQVVSSSGGSHEIWTTFAEQDVLLMRVRPVGTLEIGEIRDVFSPDWVPELIEALQLAQRIADRPEPWKPWVAA